MIVTLISPAGLIKKAKIGFSWTTLFFGFFVPLIRGGAKWAVVMLLADCASIFLANIILSFFYNGFYLRDLLEKGYTAADAASERALRLNGFIA